MKKVKLGENLEMSRFVHGYMRLNEWNLSSKELLAFIQQAVELGITTSDHADIYGDYSCEKAFGKALQLKPELRKDLQLVTKCGIKLMSKKFPSRKIKHYDYSYEHIISSVQNSLKNLGTEYIDLFLLHRPAPFFNPEEVAKAFTHLKKSGMVLHFGVSNFSQQQFEMLETNLDVDLVSNQIEISPLQLEHFENGNIEFFLKKKIKPMAWSPLAGGNILNPKNERGFRVLHTLEEIASELDTESIDQVAYSWLLKHPTGISPVIGSGKIERLKSAVNAIAIDMSLEQWYRIYTASTGITLP